MTLFDSEGRIALWYLPGLLSSEKKVSSWLFHGLRISNLTYLIQSDIKTSSRDIGPFLRLSVKEKINNGKDPNWRIDRKYFVNKGGRRVEPGAVVFSAGWFGQGHAVGYLFSFSI